MHLLVFSTWLAENLLRVTVLLCPLRQIKIELMPLFNSVYIIQIISLSATIPSFGDGQDPRLEDHPSRPYEVPIFKLIYLFDRLHPLLDRDRLSQKMAHSARRI